MTVTALGIADVARQTGLSQDTLRWYEREGLIPRVPRSPGGRRVYDDPTVRIVHLIVRLRRTGMPVAQIKEFCAMLDQGAQTHGHRMSLLREHRERLLSQMVQLQGDLAAVDDKIGHYAELIEHGLDCAGDPMRDPHIRARQRSLT